MSLSILESRTRLPIYGLSATHIPTGPLLAPTTFGLTTKRRLSFDNTHAQSLWMKLFSSRSFLPSDQAMATMTTPLPLSRDSNWLEVINFCFRKFQQRRTTTDCLLGREERTAVWVGKQNSWERTNENVLLSRWQCCQLEQRATK